MGDGPLPVENDRHDPRDPLSVPGLYTGDCLEIGKLVPDGSIDLIVTDPPYGAGMDFPNDDLQGDDLLAFTSSWMELYARKLKPTGTMYCFIDKKKLGAFQSLLDRYLVFRNIVTWYFEGFYNGFHHNYDNRCEFILFYTRSSEYTFNVVKEPPSRSLIERWGPYADKDGNVPFEALTPSMKKRQPKERYDRNPTNINRGLYQGNVIASMIGNTVKINGEWCVAYPLEWYQSNVIAMKRERYRDHPAQKPEGLISRIVEISSNEGDVVLDPFSGSGTICAVAKRMRRKYIGIEMEKEHHEKAMERVRKEKVTMRLDSFLN